MPEPSIPLSKDRGLNARLTTCTHCGKDGRELALIGSGDYLHDCRTCGAKVLGTKQMRKCPSCKEVGSLYVDRRLEDNEKLPMGLCEECENKSKEAEEIVKAGGIYWKCSDCGSSGAIRAESGMAKAVRAHTGVAPPKPTGIEFSKEEHCPVCGPDAQEGP